MLPSDAINFERALKINVECAIYINICRKKSVIPIRITDSGFYISYTSLALTMLFHLFL
jgi:hypothetical protein